MENVGQAYIVSAVPMSGGGVSVIVVSAAAAIDKIDEYLSDGFDQILVKDLDGQSVALEDLINLAGKET